jgi:hypothetical protein
VARDGIADVYRMRLLGCMQERTTFFQTLAVVMALTFLTSCERPSASPADLKAIKAEAEMLMRVQPRDATVPRDQWPRAIAGLEPEFVMINQYGVHITTRAYFDGGWGYFVPRSEGVLPEPRGRFEELGQGTYWWHPD